MSAFAAGDWKQDKAAIDAATGDGEWCRSYCSKEEEPKLNTTMIFANTSSLSIKEWSEEYVSRCWKIDKEIPNLIFKLFGMLRFEKHLRIGSNRKSNAFFYY